MSLVVLADAQSRSGANVTQAMIDEEEAWLASKIGPLTGERTETFTDPKISGTIDGLYLSRRTDAVDNLTADGDTLTVTTDWRLVSEYIIERVDGGAAWAYPMVATYTPNDEDIVKGVIYDLLSYRLLPPNIQSIRIGQYSETYATGGTNDPVRARVVGKVLTHGGLGAYGIPFRLRRHAIDRTMVEAAES